MSDRLTKRKWSQVEDYSASESSHHSFSTASSPTRRRKTLRRMQSNARLTETMENLTSMFSNVRILGRTESYHTLDNELKTAEPDPLVVQYSLLHPPAIPDFKPERYTFVNACTPVEMNHLKHFDRPPRSPKREHIAVIETASEVVASLLSLGAYLNFPIKEDLAEVKFYGSKFAGIEYARLGLKTRSEADPLAQADAEDAWTALMGGKHIEPHDVRLGGRGKIAEMIKTEAEDKVPAVGRLILMMSQRDLKLCGVTENQLTLAYTASHYPIAVGQSWFHGGAEDFIKRFLPYEEFFCFDAKKFDSSLDPWLVTIAVNILRRQYYDGDSEKYDAYWSFVLRSLLSAPIYRDDGVRLAKEVGTTSGHSHNTLVQSICTLILGYAALIHLHPELSVEEIMENAWLESLGDDNVMGVRGPLVGHTVEEIAGVVMDMFGVDWFGKKSFATTRLLDAIEGDFQGMQFLGKYFRVAEYPVLGGSMDVVIPYRPFRETYLRLLYPEYGAHTPNDTWLRTLGNYLDGAGNTLTEQWLSGFLDWLTPRTSDPPLEWPPNFKRMVSRDYSNVGVEVPLAERIDFEQWRDLVVLPRYEYRDRWKADQPF
uniref:RNA-directed RNA-polymerase n=1 Tax=Metarhizium brunneum bipartite mycovirus 1 TaxID=2938193 RepID=A0A976N0X4_9VIRU|nr:RNA-directed RNA-polymerase [Metarhizium brunneum bipartite mycovirus 1]